MTRIILSATALSYWIVTLLWILHWSSPRMKIEKIASIAEKISLIIFTAGVVFYINQMQIINGQLHAEFYRHPVSWLLFAWSLNAAHMSTEIAYGNRVTALFASLWGATAISFSSGFGGLLRSAFTNDLLWLSFHRLCFLLGYAFCLLVFPVAIRFFWISTKAQKATPDEKANYERNLWKLDRLAYRLILWALPLLTAGIITEALILLEANRFPSPAQIWMEQKETLLALTSWFLCGIYLHLRLFLGWKNIKIFFIYLIGLFFLFLGHLSHHHFGGL